MEQARWYLRERINSLPTQGDRTSRYYFCGNRQQPQALNEYLRAIAPVIEGARLEEACINRYDVGDYMPEHVDSQPYRYNMVVHLCESGDGIEIEGQFHEDRAGRGVIFAARSVPHAVPPVRQQRYCIVYLYV